MKLNQLTATPGATKERKRIGRGYGRHRQDRR